MNTQVIDENEFKHHLIRKLTNIAKLLESGDLLFGKNIISDPVQKILSSQKEDSWFDNVIIPLIESTAIECEKTSPGSGRIFLNLALKYLPEDIRRSMLIKNDTDNFQDIKKTIDSLSMGFCKKQEFFEFIENSNGKKSKKLIYQILEKYRLGDQIEVKRSPFNETRIIKSDGYIFDNVYIEPIFLKNGKYSRKNPKIVLFEGIIESNGEIHHLLEMSHKEKMPCVILCLGIKPEPLHTITQNFARGTIDVVVASIKMDEFNIQALVDFAAVTGSQPITAFTGETLSQKVTRGLDVIDHIEFSNGKVIIQNEKTKENVRILLQDVTKRSQDNQDLGHLFQKRLKSLSSSKVTVEIGKDDADLDPHIVEEIDTFFRSAPYILDAGFIKKESLYRLPDDLLCLLFGKTDVQPIHRIGKAISRYASIKEQIERSGAVIVKDRSV